jgi:DNA end-binding protein Ku
LVTIPVRAYSARSDEQPIQFNQLHAECKSRIRIKKTCPIHGEVSADEIVLGYEFSKGRYVVVDPDEVDKLRTPDDQALKIDTFIEPGAVDPIYLTDRSFYLVPDAPVGEKAYAVLRHGMLAEGRHAIAQVVLHGREQTVLLRPVDQVIVVTVLTLENRLTKPAAFEGEIQESPVARDELDLTEKLIGALTAKKFDFSRYRDLYTERLHQLIEAKIAGQEIVAPPIEEQVPIINLMDALRQSVDEGVRDPTQEDGTE